jgi:hypothetical protein
MQVVFTVMTVNGPSIQPSHTSSSRPILDVVRIPRKDVQREASTQSDQSDTSIGMSTGRLGSLFPLLFKPAEEEDEGEPFFMS